MNRIKTLLIAVGLLAFSATLSFAQVGPQSTFQLYNGYADPCQSAAAVKLSVPVNVSTATTTQLVAPTSGKKVYACGLRASMMGTLPTALFVTGTGSSCGTGTASATGTFAPTAGSILSLVDGITNFTSPAGSAVCLTSGGTTPSIQGVFVYVVR